MDSATFLVRMMQVQLDLQSKQQNASYSEQRRNSDPARNPSVKASKLSKSITRVRKRRHNALRQDMVWRSLDMANVFIEPTQ